MHNHWENPGANKPSILLDTESALRNIADVFLKINEQSSGIYHKILWVY